MSPEKDLARQLRIATADDRPAVEAIVEAAYTNYIERIGRKPGPMLDDYSELIGAGRVHVMECDGTPQGVLVLIPERDAMLLDNIAVDPSAQKTGLGRQMMVFAETVAREAGYKTIRLYTHVTMTENIALYGKIGFVETHRGVEKGLHRVYMSKQL
jgi:ribosomal protein S18 acetylase RimI-like enzyme